MIRSLYFTQDGTLETNLDPQEFPRALQDKAGLLWVDFEANPPAEDEPILHDVFGFHPLAIEDALQENHVPKLDDWVDYLYIVLHAILFDKGKDDYLETQELDIFLGLNYMVTHHDQPIRAIDTLLASVQRDDRPLRNGADHLLYRLVDTVVDNYMPIVEALDDEIDRKEDEIFSAPTSGTLEEIFALKRAVLNLRRILAPQREVVNKLARDDFAVIDTRDRIYFRDIYDHLVRLYDITESVRDLLSGTLDTYLSVINNRMNDIMRTLTVITTLFMPISFVTGFFGMNFFSSDHPLVAWVGRPVFFVVVAMMLLTPIAMVLWMRRRGWMD
jgi:magnesium transporter